MTGKDKKESGKLGNLYLLSTVGVQLAISVFIGLGAGIFVDKVLGTEPVFLFIFLLAGIGAGFLNLYRVAKKEFGEEEDTNGK